MKNAKRQVIQTMLIGLVTIAPLWITWVFFEVVLGLLANSGRPLLRAFGAAFSPFSPAISDWLQNSVFEKLLALLITLSALYLVGLLASVVFGKKLIAALEALLARVPVIQTIYSGTKRFLQTLRTPPISGQRVVLINFPSRDLKTLGLVTKLMRDSETGQELAAVYVPTSPNPTSGYIEIVPLSDTIPIDWTVEQALSFVVTGGANAPDTINYTRRG